jgi:uncharacterized membrane protein YkoI
MRFRFASIALVLTLSALPLAIACERGENEAAEEVEEANEANEAAEPAEGAETQAALLSEATIDSLTARATALAAVPGGEVTRMELEREDSLLIWSFDIKVPGQEGVEEVHVDAKTGAVVKTEHESTESEAAEAAEEGGGR